MQEGRQILNNVSRQVTKQTKVNAATLPGGGKSESRLVRIYYPKCPVSSQNCETHKETGMCSHTTGRRQLTDTISEDPRC